MLTAERKTTPRARKWHFSFATGALRIAREILIESLTLSGVAGEEARVVDELGRVLLHVRVANPPHRIIDVATGREIRP